MDVGWMKKSFDWDLCESNQHDMQWRGHTISLFFQTVANQN